MKIGILQTGLAPDTLAPDFGEYPAQFARLLDGNGFSFEAWEVVNGTFPSGPEDADGWLITGSKHGAYEDHPWIPPLEDLIRAIYAADRPLVGICFGHQIIAQALGGRVEKWRGGWAVGRQSYDWNGETLSLNAWHQDQVVEKPADAERLATSDFCENAALIYGKRAFTVQAHPEFGDEFIDGLVRERGRGVVPDDLLDTAIAPRSSPVDNPTLARQIARFFKERTPA